MLVQNMKFGGTWVILEHCTLMNFRNSSFTLYLPNTFSSPDEAEKERLLHFPQSVNATQMSISH